MITPTQELTKAIIQHLQQELPHLTIDQDTHNQLPPQIWVLPKQTEALPQLPLARITPLTSNPTIITKPHLHTYLYNTTDQIPQDRLIKTCRYGYHIHQEQDYPLENPNSIPQLIQTIKNHHQQMQEIISQYQSP